MDREKRNGNTPIPANLMEKLSEAQRKALPGIKCAGWEPWFLRQQMFQAPTLVMNNAIDGRIGLMDQDGRLRIQDDIKVREQESEAQKKTPKNLYYF
jgi:hypothetical protein